MPVKTKRENLFCGEVFRVFDRGQNNCYFDSAVKDTNMHHFFPTPFSLERRNTLCFCETRLQRFYLINVQKTQNFLVNLKTDKSKNKCGKSNCNMIKKTQDNHKSIYVIGYQEHVSLSV